MKNSFLQYLEIFDGKMDKIFQIDCDSNAVFIYEI